MYGPVSSLPVMEQTAGRKESAPGGAVSKNWTRFGTRSSAPVESQFHHALHALRGIQT